MVTWLFWSGDGTESVIGFQAKCYLSSEIPTFQTVARSSLAYTAFFWIIGILFATIFLTKEYNTGTIKLSVAYGTKRTILYYTKAITIWWCLWNVSDFCSYIFRYWNHTIRLHSNCEWSNKPFGMGSCLRNGFISIRKHFYFFMCRYSNTGIVTGICCLYVFSGASVYLMLWSDMETVSIPLKFFVYGNPMYYWMNFSSCRTMGLLSIYHSIS